MVKTMLILALALLIPAPKQTVDQYGKTHAVAELQGQVTVIDFAASWCKPCWKALPHVEALAKEFPDLKVLVISEDDQRAGRDKLVKKLNLSVPVIWDDGHVWAETFQPKGMPTTLILDKDGSVLYRHEGYSEAKWQEFRAHLKQHL